MAHPEEGTDVGLGKQAVVEMVGRCESWDKPTEEAQAPNQRKAPSSEAGGGREGEATERSLREVRGRPAESSQRRGKNFKKVRTDRVFRVAKRPTVDFV